MLSCENLLISMILLSSCNNNAIYSIVRCNDMLWNLRACYLSVYHFLIRRYSLLLLFSLHFPYIQNRLWGFPFDRRRQKTHKQTTQSVKCFFSFPNTFLYFITNCHDFLVDIPIYTVISPSCPPIIATPPP